MSTESITFLNFILHSLIIGAAGWLIVRFALRDARQRSTAVNIVLLVMLLAQMKLSFRWSAGEAMHVEVIETLQQTIDSPWRVQIDPLPVAKTEQAPSAAVWSFEDALTVIRQLCFGITCLLLLRLLFLTARTQFWAWSLRRPTEAETQKIPANPYLSRIRVFEGEGTPCVAGWFWPVIAIPASAFEKRTRNEWLWLLRHEAAHFDHGDTLTHLLQKAFRTFHWWNPFVHALIDQHDRAREEVCDAAALGEAQEAEGYASFLLEWAALPAARPALVTPIVRSRPARLLQARLTALIQARGVRKKVGALFLLGCLAFSMLAPFVAASFGITTAQAEPTKPEKMYTRLYQVPPDFGGGVSAQEFLEKKGVAFPEGSSVVHQKATSTLLVRNWPANLNSIEEIVARASQTHPQVLFRVKLIQGGSLLSQHGAILPKDVFEKIVRDSSQQKGINILSAPSVTTKPGQRATVEVIREILNHPQDKGEMKKLGPSIELTAAATETAKSRVEAKVSLGLDTTEDWSITKTEWDRVQIHTTSGNDELASGETLVLHLTTPKTPVTVFITTTAINPAGKETSFDQRGPSPSAGVDLPDKPALEVEERTYPLPALLQESTNPVAMLREQKFAVGPGDASIKEGKLTVKATKATLELIKVWLETLHGAQERANKQIYITVIAVNVNKPWDAFTSLLVPKEAPKAPDTKPASQNIPPGAFLLSGVLTDPQFQIVVRELTQKEKAPLQRLHGASVKPGVESSIDMPAEFGFEKLVITPSLGADGYTIELNISAKPSITTSATIWDGQTVVLSAPQLQSTPALFITAQIISPLPKK
jgi:beta-lactamase regulating signal transducer with metallopeptidase domain